METYPQLQRLYIAMFGRPADPAGLAYWGDILATDPGALPTIAGTLASSVEFNNIFAGKDSGLIVDTIYQHLFSRGADPAARDYWGAQLTAGVSVASTALTILGAAQGSDMAAVDAKTAAAIAFTSALDTPLERAAFAGERAVATAREYLAYVHDTQSQGVATTPFALETVTADIVAGRAWSMPNLVTQQVQDLYVTYFTRPAEPGGLDYWSSLLDGNPANPSLGAIAAAFAATDEYKAEYMQGSTALVVDAVYQNLFSRPADTTGRDYWAGLLDSGAVTLDTVVTQIAGAAQGADLYAHLAKISVARAITTAIDTPQEEQSYAGGGALEKVTSYMAAVKDEPTYNVAINPIAIDALILSFTDSTAVGANEAVTLVGVPAPDFGGLIV